MITLDLLQLTEDLRPPALCRSPLFLLSCPTAITVVLEMVVCVTWCLPTHDLSLMSYIPQPHADARLLPPKRMTFTLGSAYPRSSTTTSLPFPTPVICFIGQTSDISSHISGGKSPPRGPAEPRTERHSERIRFEIGLIAPFHHLFGLG